MTAFRVKSLVHQIAAWPSYKFMGQLRAILNDDPPLKPELRQLLIRALEDAAHNFKTLADVIKREASQ
jgi:hypothetical protein